MTDSAREPHFVQSLDRGLAVIRAFDAHHRELTLSEVARICDLTRAAARRFLLTLTDLGYVRTNGRLFALTPRVLELGWAFLSATTLPEVAGPHLERLAAEVHESSSVAVLDGDDIVYVARVPTRRIMTVAITVGTRFPAYATAMGRVLLAHRPATEVEAYLARVRLERLTGRTVATVTALRAELDRTRELGYALVDQELEEGLRSLAAPVRDRSGAVTAAVNVSVPAGRTPVAAMRAHLLPPLLATAERITADLRVTTPVR